MRKTHFSDKALWRVLGKEERNLWKLGKELDVTFEIKRSGESAGIIIKGGSPIHEYIVSEILEAIASGFDLETALLLRDEEFIFKKINLKTYAHGSRLEVVKGRIVGKEGRVKQVIQDLSECFICLADNNASIIGKAENAELASRALEAIIRGSKHANIFKLLEKSRARLKKLEQENIEELIKK